MTPTPNAAAVLVAAGNSTRMGAGERKPFRSLGGRSILEHACAAFDAEYAPMRGIANFATTELHISRWPA